jgi:hypothetical protein
VSYETTLANAKARAAEHEWKAHRTLCHACAAAAKARKWDRLCVIGAPLWAVKGFADRDLAENRRLDKLPIPGQGELT